MFNPENLNYILAFIALLSVGFNVYSKIRNPQTELDKRQAVDNEESEKRADILSEKVQWEKEATEKRFIDVANRLNESTALAQNHIHSVQIQVENLTTIVNTLNTDLRRDIAKLETIINERLPKK